ncbi:hypothetical protein PLEOSDRAFT_1109600 [Pleurotus ostreatus PC15]|uniref:Uncharacterized protein n=1 Tax=Pleurotus ostreatus (strain PC15) TaxID=1137138 RepID=A0A067N699_PLEO1|nr:hypothetical protein PLEOSDRAFT_1109600 [Pleurotus ostreatus PC15]
MSRAKSKPIEGRLHPVDGQKAFKVDFDLLTEDFNNIVLEDVLKRVKGKSVDSRLPTFIRPATTPGPQSYTVGAPFPGAYPDTPAPHGGATDHSNAIITVLRKVCDDDDIARLCAQLLSKARDSRDIRAKAPNLLKEHIVPQMNDEKLGEIVRELEALFNDAIMHASFSSRPSVNYQPHIYGNSESISAYTPTSLQSNERVGPLHFSSEAQAPVFIKPEYTTSIPLATSSAVNERPQFGDQQQEHVGAEPVFIHPGYSHLPHVSPPPALVHQADTNISTPITQAVTMEVPPPLPQPFTILSLPSSPQPGFVVNHLPSSRMSAPPAGTPAGSNEQRVAEVATGVNATAPVGPVGPVPPVQGPSTAFLIDTQGKVLHRDAGGTLRVVAELVYHNKDKGPLEKGAGSYKSRVIECRRKVPAALDSPIVPASWSKLIGDLFMVHVDKSQPTEGMWLHQGGGKWTNITHQWNSASLDANHAVRHPENPNYCLTRTKDFPNWILLQSQVDKEKKRLKAANGSRVSFGSVTTYPPAAGA